MPLTRVAGPVDLPPPLAELVARPAAVLARGRVLKHDATTTVTLLPAGERGWVVKRYNTKNRWHAVRRQVRTSRALNCWRAAAWLGDADIDTPKPITVLEERCWRLLRGRSYLICAYVQGVTLDKALDPREPAAGREALIEHAAGIIRRLRQHGIVHGDLKATNFIVGDGRIFLTDLDAARRPSGRRLAAGLDKDLRRFLRNWEDQPALAEAFLEQLSLATGPISL